MNNQAPAAADRLSVMRKLGLWGMAQHSESLIRLPLDQHPTADQMVAQLIESEQAHRQHRKTQRLVREAERSPARFRDQAAVEEIAYLPTRNLDKSQVLRLADLSFIERGENILITGATGCGKSFLASALGHQACHRGLRVAYFSLSKLFQKLHLAQADGSYLKEMARLEKQHLLISDDWGLQALSLSERLVLLQLIEDRHGRGSTIITSQLPVSAWHDYPGDATLADALLDRLVHQSHRIELKRESMRKRTASANQKGEEKLLS